MPERPVEQRPRRRWWRWVLAVVLAPFAATALWALAAFGLARVPVNADFAPPPVERPGVDIYVISNGVHTDVAMPYVSPWHDFRRELPVTDTRIPTLPMGLDALLAVGWGSRGFYLETPTWADLKASTAFKSLFWLDRTAMHVTFHPAPPPLGARVRRFRIDPVAYQRLVAFVAHQFAPPTGLGEPPNAPRAIQRPGGATADFPDDGLHPVRIPGVSYGNTDAFYEARDTYSLFNTCNTWTARALDAAGVRTGAWTPLEQNLMNSLPASAPAATPVPAPVPAPAPATLSAG